MIIVRYKHWKNDSLLLEIAGDIVHDNPQSDRIVVRTPDNEHEDIIRDTIVEIIEFVD